MIITISGMAGSGKSTAAKLVAKKLGLRHYSVGDLRRKMAEDMGITLAELNRRGEKDDFSDRTADEYQKKLGQEEDGFVIDSRLGFHFVPHSIKVFLTADIRTRAGRVYRDEREREKFSSVEDCGKALAQREKSDAFRYKKYYGIDHLEKKHYDLIIDTTKLPAEKVAERIVKSVKGMK